MKNLVKKLADAIGGTVRGHSIDIDNKAAVALFSKLVQAKETERTLYEALGRQALRIQLLEEELARATEQG